MMNCILLLLCISFAADAVQPKIGFLTEEFRYGDAWKRFGLYSTLKKHGMTGNAVKSMSWVFGQVPEETIYQELCRYHAVIISLDRGFQSADYDRTTLNYRNGWDITVITILRIPMPTFQVSVQELAVIGKTVYTLTTAASFCGRL